MKYVAYILAAVLLLTSVAAYDGPTYRFTNFGGGVAPWTWGQGYSDFTYSQNGFNSYGSRNSGDFVRFSKTPYDSYTYGNIDGTRFSAQTTQQISVAQRRTSSGSPYQVVSPRSAQLNQFSIGKSGSYNVGLQRRPSGKFGGAVDYGSHAGGNPYRTRVYNYPGFRHPRYASSVGYSQTAASQYRYGGTNSAYVSAYTRY